MDDFQHLCPVCKAKGVDIYLQLRQINLSTAVYLCKNLKCSYPAGHQWIFVDRDLFQDDESDSDISDCVNKDIEEMNLKLFSNTCNSDENVNNNCSIDKHNNSNKNIISEFVELETPVIVNIENTNVVIEDPHNLFSTLSLPNKEESLSAQHVLAVGMPDLEVVNINIPNNFDILDSNNQDKKLHLEKEHKKDSIIDPKKESVTEICNPEVIPVNICNINSGKEVEESVQIIIENREINKPDIKNNKQTKYFIKNSNTGRNEQVMKVLISNKKNNEQSCTKSENQSCNSKLDNIETDNVKSIYETPIFESAFKSKLKLQCRKKQPPSFTFNESIIKEALETINMPKVEPRIKPVRSLVQRIMNKKVPKKTAASFDGFEFSSKSLKPDGEHEKNISLQETATKLNLTNKQENICEVKQEITTCSQTETHVDAEKVIENTLDQNNSSANNMSIDDISFSELFDNLEPANVPNISASMLDVDEWLNSF